MAIIIDGKALAKKMQKAIAEEVAQLQTQYGRPPGLAVLMVGDSCADGGRQSC